jgi:hypothetical protein
MKMCSMVVNYVTREQRLMEEFETVWSQPESFDPNDLFAQGCLQSTSNFTAFGFDMVVDLQADVTECFTHTWPRARDSMICHKISAYRPHRAQRSWRPYQYYAARDGPNQWQRYSTRCS